MTTTLCVISLNWQAVHHVCRGGPVEEHHLGQLCLCRPLRFQPCKSSWWWWWHHALSSRLISLDYVTQINRFSSQYQPHQIPTIGEYSATTCQWVCLACLQDLPLHCNVPFCWPHNGLVNINDVKSFFGNKNFCIAQVWRRNNNAFSCEQWRGRGKDQF